MGAKVNSIYGVHKFPPLLIAAMGGHKLCVETLLNNAADILFALPKGSTVLSVAAAHCRAPDIVKTLLLPGINIRTDTKYELHVAAETGNETKIEEIITKSHGTNR